MKQPFSFPGFSTVYKLRLSAVRCLGLADRVEFVSGQKYSNYPFYSCVLSGLGHSYSMGRCCSSILSLVQFLSSFVLYSLSYINTRKNKGK